MVSLVKGPAQNFYAVLLFCVQLCLAGPFDLIPPLALDARLNYDFGGSTVLSRNYVQLTSDLANQQGYIVSNFPSHVPKNFVLEMEFRINGENYLYGDGMSLWFLQEKPLMGTMFGLNEYYNGTTLALDTYRNANVGKIFPRLILMQNDGTQTYDKSNDGAENDLASCGLRGIYNNNRQEFNQLRVTYSSIHEFIIVDVNYRNKWESCISTNLNMGPVTHIAVSAATGDLSSDHVVKQLRLIDCGGQVPEIIQKAVRNTVKQEPRAPTADKGSSSVFGFLAIVFKFILKFAAVILGVFVALKSLLWCKRNRKLRDDDKFKLI